MTLAIQGFDTEIARELRKRVAPDGNTPDEAVRIGRWPKRVWVECERYVFLSGYLAGERLVHQSARSLENTWHANFADVARQCDDILRVNDMARIVVVGSHSAVRGSYDMAYAGAKAALHLYVETKALRRQQQLVCVAPSMVEGGMTARRSDQDNVERARLTHPKGRLLRPDEVARMIHFLLYVDEGYTSGTVIHMHGGLR